MRLSDPEAIRLSVLKAIRRSEPTSRTELVTLTGLANTTIADITSDLVRRKVVLETRSTAGVPGRPRQHLAINPDAGYAVGAFLMHDRSLSVEIINPRGDKLFSTRTQISASNLEELAEKIASVVDQTIADGPVKRSQILRVGAAIHGTLDSVNGVVHWFYSFPSRPVAFAEIMERRLKIPVSIDNVVNVMARAEHWFGVDRDLDDFGLVYVGTGLGFSQYVDGALRIGAHGLAAEFAHLKMGAVGGPPCVCGAQDCLATYATIYGIVQRVCEARGRPAPDLDDVERCFEEIAQEARLGEPLARKIFGLAGQYLGMAVANLINLLDPARMVVLALNPSLAELIVASFHTAVQDYTLPSLRGRARVQFKAEDEVNYAHGAAALVLEDIYGFKNETPAKRA